ncbi:hypothetical protein Val02_40780 [Virgisporangium aliadipatigenens]|uniref:Uncharacterized protein n=1 Tax=Virgisporangium aliadipatigenens TaxID=741659 RepID=A0A8J3YMN7_9ACTN|nr:hypothetical protein Val02_40780 [Virgisporangium aliadipatigenens]
MTAAHDERQRALVERIAAILAALMPEDAVRIRADGELAESNAGVAFDWVTDSGAVGAFPFDDQPFEAVIEMSDAFVALRDATVAAGQEEWSGIAFTLERDGRFDVELRYADRTAT